MKTFEYHTSSRTILADLYTPVGVYMRLRDLYPQSALMESSDYHDKSNARSFIGIQPIASVAVGHGIATINYPYKECELEFDIKDEIPAPTDPLMEAMRALYNKNNQLMMQPALTFAAEVIKAKPHMCSGDLCEYVTEVITAIKKAL
jgi:anthranilate/para-aminobenzoate synthase component I